MQEKDLKLSELESDNRKMKVELEEFRTEATHLKNQQATIRRLEERTRQLEQQVRIASNKVTMSSLCYSNFVALYLSCGEKNVVDYMVLWYLFSCYHVSTDTRTDGGESERSCRD